MVNKNLSKVFLVFQSLIDDLKLDSLRREKNKKKYRKEFI